MFGKGGDSKKKSDGASDGVYEGGDAGDPAAAPVEDKKVGTMPSGDYTIHFHL